MNGLNKLILITDETFPKIIEEQITANTNNDKTNIHIYIYLLSLACLTANLLELLAYNCILNILLGATF